ncbi:MAG TPA: cell envelope integrity protein TolA [Candidatus Bathyarchaeia archaeon]|nr:cell envelope integrity protein TolA [Candidatus Bathyarchaeia archaeon]
MKRTLFAMILVLGLGWAAAPAIGAAPSAPPQGFGATLDINYCYDYLAPYGSWIDLDPYGYVWCPRHMGYGWRPYSEGRWFWTDDGWCWDSDLDWGWIPFHYGRWGWNDDCGWYWVPGTVWGPAWVFWRFGDLYAGWAPIPPGFDFRAGVDFDAFAVGLPLNFWCFVDGRHFLDRDVRSYVLPYERNSTIARMTELRNRYDFRGGRMIDEGIDPQDIHRVTGRPVTRYAIANADRPGGPQVSGRELRVYRPEIRAGEGARPKQFVPRGQASREMGAARVYEGRPNARNAAPEAAVRKGQAQERKRLEQSQAQERRNLEQGRSAASRTMANQAERARIDQEYQARRAEQQKQHQAERQQMAERHRAEAERVQRSAPPQPAPQQRGGRRK